jgi:hypothetical protein
MRAWALGLVVVAVGGLVTLADPTPAVAACKSPMRPGSWTGTVTQDLVVRGVANGVLEADMTGRSSGNLAIQVVCSGKVTGKLAGASYTVDGTFGNAGFRIPVQCSGTAAERAVAGKVTKGAGGKPVIDLSWEPSPGDTFRCAPGPLGDAINATFEASGAATGTTTPGSPNGIRLPASEATKSQVRGTSFQSTGGFDPIALATQNLQQLGLTPQITQGFEFTRG